ncbi:hypothetical protein EGW08_019064, partial [Elysia chlorotica]
VSFQFQELALDPEDKLTVYDGAGRTAPVITHIDGLYGAQSPTVDRDVDSLVAGASVRRPPLIVSSGNRLFVSLSTAGGGSRKIVAKYVQGCDLVVRHTDPVLILSPGYGVTKYPALRNCSWTVQGSNARRNLIFLPQFHTEPANDVVKVYNSLSPHKVTLLATLSGSSLSQTQAKHTSQSGDFHITFQTDQFVSQGSWAALISTDCNRLEEPHLRADVTDTSFGARVELSCEDGYYLNGDSARTCWLGGRWFPDHAPVCKDITCGA